MGTKQGLVVRGMLVMALVLGVFVGPPPPPPRCGMPCWNATPRSSEPVTSDRSRPNSRSASADGSPMERLAASPSGLRSNAGDRREATLEATGSAPRVRSDAPSVTGPDGPTPACARSTRTTRTCSPGSTQRASSASVPFPAYQTIYDNFGDIVRLPHVPVHRHQGDDIQAPSGARIVAPFDGYASTSRSKLGGVEVRVFGADGYVYNAHIGQLGQLALVSAGDTVGFVGVTGDADGTPRPPRMASEPRARAGPQRAARRRRARPASLATRRGEVLVVGGPGPGTTPGPSDRVERPPGAVVPHEHPASDRRPSDVRGAVGRRDTPRPDVGILHRVDVDRPAKGVLRPGAADTVAVPAVECRGVVRSHEAHVVGAVAIDEPHPPDREPRVIELAEDTRDLVGPPAMHHQLACVRPPVESPVREADEVDRPMRPGTPHARTTRSLRARSAGGRVETEA